MSSDPSTGLTSQETAADRSAHTSLSFPASLPRLSAADILENISDAFIAVDHAWRIFYANRQACTLSRKPQAEFLGQTLWGEWPAAAGTEAERQFHQAMEQPTPVHFEYRQGAVPDDQCFEIDAYSTDSGLNIFYRDITERKRTQRQLSVSEERLRLAVEGAGLGTWHWDVAAEVLIWSDRCRVLFGMPPDIEISYFQFLDCVHPEDRVATDQAILHALGDKTSYDLEHRVVWPDGTNHWLNAKGRGYYDDQGSPLRFEGIVQDITERKERERERQEFLQRQRAFLRDVLASVTEGRLHLCDAATPLPQLLPQFGDTIPLNSSALSDIRALVQAAALSVNFPGERAFDLVSATSECAMNAVVHAGGGIGSVHLGNGDTIQVCIEDHGRGISVESLPRATLEKGYTTAGTMGYGFKMMLLTVDRVWLQTGPEGTTVVLEQNRRPTEPLWG